MSDNLFMNKETMIILMKGTSAVFAILPALVGVGYGLVHGSKGVCKAADYSVDLVHAIMPMAFISAPSIFSLIMFFFITMINPTELSQAIRMLAASIIQGVGNCFGAYCIGCIAGSASVTKAQQKKFSGSFFLVMIFGEIVALFSLVAGIIFLTLGGTPDK